MPEIFSISEWLFDFISKLYIPTADLTSYTYSSVNKIYSSMTIYIRGESLVCLKSQSFARTFTQ